MLTIRPSSPNNVPWIVSVLPEDVIEIVIKLAKFSTALSFISVILILRSLARLGAFT